LSDAFDDITNFGGSGFGDFSRLLLSLIVIASLTIMISTTTELVTAPEETLLFIFALTLIFSYVNWMRLDIDTIPFESLKQWFISIIVGFSTVMALLRKWGVFR
jgi:hypothetical protein